MFFTQEDYIKIQQWLTKNSVKDTEFNEANIPFNGEETITIVQGNQNKKVFLKDLIAQVFNLGISDFVNITDKYDAPNISLEEAIRLIPSRARKEGQVITFLDTEDHWHIYQFKGVLNQWNVLDQWKDLFDFNINNFIIDSILPDEEDLTKSSADENGNSYLSLKDRAYNPEDFSGLGRIILRKNIVEVEDPIYGKVKKNSLYRDMINKENTIYEIRYDFDLNGQEITIPEGCTLDFQGGSLNNGTIVLTKTNNIQGTARFTNLYIRGDYGYSISADWFENLNACLNSIRTEFKNIILSAKEYYIDAPLNLTEGYILQGCNKDEWTDKYSTSIKVSDTFVGDSVIVIGETGGNHNVKILNINIKANSDINGITVPYNFYGLELNNVYVYNANKSFSFSTFWTSIINRCNSYNSKYGFYLDGQTTTSTNFNNCVVFGGDTAFYVNIALNGTSFTNCAIDGSKIGFDILYGNNIVINNLSVEQFYTHAIRVNHSNTKLYVNNLTIGANYVSNSHIIDIENIGAAIFVNCAMPSVYMPSDNSYYGIYIADTIDASKVVFVSCLLYDYRSPSFKNATHLMSSVAPFKSLGLERYIPQVIKYPYETELNTMSIESEFVDIVPVGSSRILKANPIFVTNAKNNSIITLINKGEYSVTIMPEGSYYGETGIIGSTIVLHPNDSVRLNYRDSKFYVVDKKGKATNSSRPALSADEIGEGLFDTDLNKPIWWTGEKWVDATGANV